MRNLIVKYLRVILIIPQLFWGWIVFLVTNKTPASAYQSMITFFCLTGGRSNDFLHGLLKHLYPPYVVRAPVGILGEMTPENTRLAVSDLIEKGYHIFKEKLSEELCDKLLAFSLETEAVVRLTSDELKVGAKVKSMKLDRNNPQGIRYDFKESSVLACPEVQRIVSDRSILSVAQGYLECKPILDIVAMWWHTYSEKPDEEAAQYWHFDMDRIKWLKFFFYVTDVTPETGPHCFVSGSQKKGGIPSNLLKKGNSPGFTGNKRMF